MSDFDDLDSLLGPLREPATAAELASERAMIDLMTTSHRHAKGNIMFSSRRARVATLIAAGVIGFGGVAAAGGGGFDLDNLAPQEVEETEIEEVEVEEVEVEEEEVEEIAEITTTTAAAVEESDDDTFTDEVAKATLAAVAVANEDEESDDNPDADFDESDCVEGGNHGETVSAVARGDEGYADFEVRDAAHSDCGKTDDLAAVDDDEESDDVEEDSDEKSVESDDDDIDDEDSDEDDVDDDDSDEDAGRESKGDRGNGGNGNHGKSGNDD